MTELQWSGPTQREIAFSERELGIERAIDRADRAITGWGFLAVTYLIRFAMGHREFAGFEVTDASRRIADFPQPSNTRSWGAVYVAAQKASIIANTGKTKPHPTRHACPAIIWRSLL